jgi:hypothetical protein
MIYVAYHRIIRITTIYQGGSDRLGIYIACMLEMRNAYTILSKNREQKRLFSIPRHRSEDNVKVDVRKVGFESMNWID